MNFPGYRLPDELLVLREQIRRIIRDEIIPIEQRIDPDAPEIPEDDYRRLAVKTQAAGLWALGAPEEYGGGGLDTFSMCVALAALRLARARAYHPASVGAGLCPRPAIRSRLREGGVKFGAS